MLKQLLKTLRSSGGLDRAFSEFDEMLEHAQWMFVRANEVLKRREDSAAVRDTLYRRDQAINGLLRSIRRKIVRQLTVNPGVEVAPSLALVSVAKDAERIGDYCKNVFEVGQFYTEDFHVARYHEPLEQVSGRVVALFDAVRAAFAASDVPAARKAMATAEDIRGRCDEIIEQLLGDRTHIKTHEAVAYSLLARHYKRVAAHLSNVCTAVLGRIEGLDFADE